MFISVMEYYAIFLYNFDRYRRDEFDNIYNVRLFTLKIVKIYYYFFINLLIYN